MNKEQEALYAAKIVAKALADDQRKKETPEPASLIESVGHALGILEELSETAGERLTAVEHEALKLVIACMNDREMT